MPTYPDIKGPDSVLPQLDLPYRELFPPAKTESNLTDQGKPQKEK